MLEFMEENKMKLRWDSYTVYKGKKTILYEDDYNFVIPIYDEKMIDDKCIQDEWGGYVRPVTPDEIGDIYSVRPYAIYKGHKVALRGSRIAEKMAIGPTDIDNTDSHEVIKALGIPEVDRGDYTMFVPSKDLDFYERVKYYNRYEYFKGVGKTYKVEDYHVIIKDGEMHRYKVE